MKTLSGLLAICLSGSIDAMAPCLMQSFRAPGIITSASRSLGIARRWQHQESQSCADKSVEKHLKERRKISQAREDEKIASWSAIAIGLGLGIVICKIEDKYKHRGENIIEGGSDQK